MTSFLYHLAEEEEEAYERQRDLNASPRALSQHIHQRDTNEPSQIAYNLHRLLIQRDTQDRTGASELSFRSITRRPLAPLHGKLTLGGRSPFLGRFGVLQRALDPAAPAARHQKQREWKEGGKGVWRSARSSSLSLHLLQARGSFELTPPSPHSSPASPLRSSRCFPLRALDPWGWTLPSRGSR